MEKSPRWMIISHQNCSFPLQVNRNKNLKVYQRSLNTSCQRVKLKECMEESPKWLIILLQNYSFSLQVNRNKNLPVTPSINIVASIMYNCTAFLVVQPSLFMKCLV